MADVTRGVLAEYLVAHLICPDPKHLASPDLQYDCLTESGKYVEVKSTAYVQDWITLRPTTPRFGGLKGRTYLQPDGTYATLPESQYHSDIFVFCVLTEKDRDKVDPLNLDQWEFYVLTKRVLMKADAPDALGLPRIRQLGVEACDWRSLKAQVDRAARDCDQDTPDAPISGNPAEPPLAGG
jgi:hypothetical protein